LIHPAHLWPTAFLAFSWLDSVGTPQPGCPDFFSPDFLPYCRLVLLLFSVCCSAVPSWFTIELFKVFYGQNIALQPDLLSLTLWPAIRTLGPPVVSLRFTKKATRFFPGSPNVRIPVWGPLLYPRGQVRVTPFLGTVLFPPPCDTVSSTLGDSPWMWHPFPRGTPPFFQFEDFSRVPDLLISSSPPPVLPRSCAYCLCTSFVGPTKMSPPKCLLRVILAFYGLCSLSDFPPLADFEPCRFCLLCRKALALLPEETCEIGPFSFHQVFRQGRIFFYWLF